MQGYERAFYVKYKDSGHYHHFSELRRARKSSACIFGDVGQGVIAQLRGQACAYCGAPGTHVDHIHPLARGGWHDAFNLVSACGRCNLSKGSKLLTEWDAERVAYAVARNRKVAAEFACLQELERYALCLV